MISTLSKYSNLFFLLTFSLLVACSGGKTNNKVKDMDSIPALDDVSSSFYYFDLEKHVNSGVNEPFLLNTISKDVRFIPLETNEDCLMSERHFKYVEFDNYYIASCDQFEKIEICVFDLSGKFVKKVLWRGNAPNKIAECFHWFYNKHLNQVGFVGYNKILKYDIYTYCLSTVSLKNSSPTPKIELLDNGYFVVSPINANNVYDNSYMHIYNNEGYVYDTYYYEKERDLKYRIPAGKHVSPFESYNFFSTYDNGVLFKDMYNDTIYKNTTLVLTPKFNLYTGKLTPVIEDTKTPEKQNYKIFITSIAESEKLFFVRFTYLHNGYVQVWDKMNQKLISNYTITNINGNTISPVKYITPDNQEIWVEIKAIDKNRIFCVLSASQAMNFISGLDEDSNPVLMIVDI